MFLPKPLRKLVGIFRGSVSPSMILVTVILGVWFGLTPGWYGLHTAIVFFVLIFNVGIGFFLFFAGVGKALTLILRGPPSLLFVQYPRTASVSRGRMGAGLPIRSAFGVSGDPDYRLDGFRAVLGGGGSGFGTGDRFYIRIAAGAAGHSFSQCLDKI